MKTGTFDEEEKPPFSAIIRTPWHWAAQTQPYAAGGVTFTYPVGWFISTPTIHVGLEIPPGSASILGTNVLYYSITANSSVNTVVEVMTFTPGSGTIQDASTTVPVTVHIFATGPFL